MYRDLYYRTQGIWAIDPLLCPAYLVWRGTPNWNFHRYHHHRRPTSSPTASTSPLRLYYKLYNTLVTLSSLTWASRVQDRVRHNKALLFWTQHRSLRRLFKEMFTGNQ